MLLVDTLDVNAFPTDAAEMFMSILWLSNGSANGCLDKAQQRKRECEHRRESDDYGYFQVDGILHFAFVAAVRASAFVSAIEVPDKQDPLLVDFRKFPSTHPATFGVTIADVETPQLLFLGYSPHMHCSSMFVYYLCIY